MTTVGSVALSGVGWIVLHAPDIAPDTSSVERADYGEVVLQDLLTLAIRADVLRPWTRDRRSGTARVRHSGGLIRCVLRGGHPLDEAQRHQGAALSGPPPGSPALGPRCFGSSGVSWRIAPSTPRKAIPCNRTMQMGNTRRCSPACEPDSMNGGRMCGSRPTGRCGSAWRAGTPIRCGSPPANGGMSSWTSSPRCSGWSTSRVAGCSTQVRQSSPSEAHIPSTGHQDRGSHPWSTWRNPCICRHASPVRIAERRIFPRDGLDAVPENGI